MGTPPAHTRRTRSRRSIAVASVLALSALAAIPAVLAAVQDNVGKVTVCHRSDSETNPYQQISVPIDAKDGTINGHETHTGPLFPASNWGDIIPPYTWTDEGGVDHEFQYNWPDGEKIWQHGCEPVTPGPPTQIAVGKSLVPSSDPGRFDLKVGGNLVAEAVGDSQGGVIDVEPGTPYKVTESGHDKSTDLDAYSIASRCTRTEGDSVVEVGHPNGASVSDVVVPEGETVICTFVNTAKASPESVTPKLECVLFRDGQSDVAYWGYDNTNGHVVTIPVGDQNTFEPASANGNGKPPTEFLAGRQVGAFTTEFDASSGSIAWHLTGNEATASTASTPCGATIELRKVTVPSNDPGVFNLLINNAVVATGGNGTTTGHLRIGTGEGTVRETAGPATNLADYTSAVECTRNGSLAVSVPGTKVDGEIAQGDTVVCTFTNTRKGTPPQPQIPLPPTPPEPNPPPVPSPPPGPAPRLDLEVTKAVEPETVVVGGRLTWTMTVTNRSSVAAADVNGLKLDDPRSFRTRLISLRASQGTCRPFTCDLGRLAPGASATVTAVTVATKIGVVANIVRVSSEEIESNYRNNVAAAIAQVVGRLTPPVGENRCDTLTVAPRVLQNGQSSVVVLTARNQQGKLLPGFRVHVRGPGVDRTVTTDRRGTVRRTVLPTRIGLVFFTGMPRALTRGGLHCRTLLGVLGASDTQVTG